MDNHRDGNLLRFGLQRMMKEAVTNNCIAYRKAILQVGCGISRDNLLHFDGDFKVCRVTDGRVAVFDDGLRMGDDTRGASSRKEQNKQKSNTDCPLPVSMFLL